MTTGDFEIGKRVSIDIDGNHRKGKLEFSIGNVAGVQIELPGTDGNHYYSKLELVRLDCITII